MALSCSYYKFLVTFSGRHCWHCDEQWSYPVHIIDFYWNSIFRRVLLTLWWATGRWPRHSQTAPILARSAFSQMQGSFLDSFYRLLSVSSHYPWLMAGIQHCLIFSFLIPSHCIASDLIWCDLVWSQIQPVFISPIQYPGEWQVFVLRLIAMSFPSRYRW